MDNAASEFPPLSRLRRAIESWSKGESGFEQLELELTHFEREIASLEDNFRQEFPYRSYEAEFVELGNELATTFVLVSVQSQELIELLENDNPHTKEQLSYLQTSTSKMQSLLGKLQRAVDAEEKFSESPYVHELIRVAYAVLEEKLPLEALKSRLDGYQMVLQQSLLDLENCKLELTPNDSLTMKESTRLLESGLELAYNFLADPSADDALEEGLASLEEAAHLLTQLSKGLKSQAVAQREKLCHRCGRVNLATLKLCAHCQAKLITTIDETRPGFDFTLSTEGEIRSRDDAPNIMERIIESCQARLLDGTRDPGLEQSIAELQRKLHRLRYPVTRMSNLSPGLGEEMRTELIEGAECFLELLEQSQEELSSLKLALKNDDEAALNQALAQFTESAEQLFEEQSEWDELSQRILADFAN